MKWNNIKKGMIVTVMFHSSTSSNYYSGNDVGTVTKVISKSTETGLSLEPYVYVEAADTDKTSLALIEDYFLGKRVTAEFCVDLRPATLEEKKSRYAKLKRK